MTLTSWRRRFSCVASVLLFGAAAAQASSAAPEPAASTVSCPPPAQALNAEDMARHMRQARDRGFLWRITRDDRVSYLYGTVHLARANWMMPGPTLQAAVRESDTIALELDLLDPGTARALQEAVAKAPALPLDDTVQARMKKQRELACLPEAADTLPADMLVVNLLMHSARHLGLFSEYAIDAVYAGMARGARKNVVALEAPAMQIGTLLGGSLEARRQRVLESLDALERGTGSAMLQRIATLWAQSRHDELATYLEWCECARNDEERAFLRRLLDDRNIALAERIDQLHGRGQRVLAAVGSLHMVGEHGLPALMAAKGYRVEPVHFRP